MKRVILTLAMAVFTCIAAPAPAALYVGTWDDGSQFVTDTNTFHYFPGGGISYPSLEGENVDHDHQWLRAGAHDMVIEMGWQPSQWLTLDGTNTLSFEGFDYGLNVARSVFVCPAVPEPGTMSLVLSGVLAMGGMARRRG